MHIITEVFTQDYNAKTFPFCVAHQNDSQLALTTSVLFDNNVVAQNSMRRKATVTSHKHCIMHNNFTLFIQINEIITMKHTKSTKIICIIKATKKHKNTTAKLTSHVARNFSAVGPYISTTATHCIKQKKTKITCSVH